MSVTLSGVVKRFDDRAAVNGVSATLAPGEFFVALGPSGCGKSTLLRLIAGLETLDAGAIHLGDRCVANGEIHVPPEARNVGVVFQSYALWPHLSARDNVAFPVEAQGASRREARQAADGHLETVALDAFAERKPAALSGGQRQRVALARCLAGGATTILMDEPLANLDPHLREAMEAELAAFHARAGATTLYITHDQREAMALADRVAVMRDGAFEQADPPDVVYARPATEHVARFIGRGAVLDGALSAAAPNGRATATVGPLSLEIAASAEAAPGPARVFVRPEQVAVGAGAGALQAEIAAVAYRGDRWEAAATAPGLSEPLALSLPTKARVGETVPIRILDAWALPDAA